MISICLFLDGSPTNASFLDCFFFSLAHSKTHFFLNSSALIYFLPLPHPPFPRSFPQPCPLSQPLFFSLYYITVFSLPSDPAHKIKERETRAEERPFAVSSKTKKKRRIVNWICNLQRKKKTFTRGELSFVSTAARGRASPLPPNPRRPRTKPPRRR